MKTITHEGQEYILKTDMEEAIKDTITKLSTRAIQGTPLCPFGGAWR